MATQNVETVTSKADLVLVTLAVLAAVAGVLGFTFLTEQPTLARVGALIGGFLLSFFLDTAAGGWWFTLFTAILGAVILLWIAGMAQRKTRA